MSLPSLSDTGDVCTTGTMLYNVGDRNLELLSPSMPAYPSGFLVPILQLGTVVVGGEETQLPVPVSRC